MPGVLVTIGTFVAFIIIVLSFVVFSTLLLELIRILFVSSKNANCFLEGTVRGLLWVTCTEPSSKGSS